MNRDSNQLIDFGIFDSFEKFKLIERLDERFLIKQTLNSKFSAFKKKAFYLNEKPV